MRRTLLALALAGATLATVTPAEAVFERRCTGTFDRFCHYQFCGFASCTTSDCVVFFDRHQGHNTGTCIGPARPDDPIES